MCKGAKYSSTHFPKWNISFDMGKFHKFSSRMNRLANEFIDESNERTKEYKKKKNNSTIDLCFASNFSTDLSLNAP